MSFTNTESNTVVECAYDSMGRRAYKKVTVNGSVTLHQRYIYRGYLQIACSDLTRSHHPNLSYILWNPTQPIQWSSEVWDSEPGMVYYNWRNYDAMTKNIGLITKTTISIEASIHPEMEE